MKKFIGLYWKIEKSKDGLWANYDKSGHKINHVVACQVAKESDIKAFVFILGKYMLIVAKLIDVTTGKQKAFGAKDRPVTEAIKRKHERFKEGGVGHLNIPEVKPPMPTAPAQPPQKKDKLEEALKRIESLDAEIKRLRLQEANNILLAWGGVCPSDWAISGDPTQMAEIIRQRGDELQTENLRLKSELIEVTKILKILEDEE